MRSGIRVTHLPVFEIANGKSVSLLGAKFALQGIPATPGQACLLVAERVRADSTVAVYV